MDEGGVIIEILGVLLDKPADGEESLHSGKVVLAERKQGVFLEWLAQTECRVESDHSTDNDWALINTTVTYRTGHSAEEEEVRLRTSKPPNHFSYEIYDLRSFKVSEITSGRVAITFMLVDGSTLPSLHFSLPSLERFYKALKLYLKITESKKVPQMYLLSDPKEDALQKSLSELDLFQDTRPKDVVSKFFRDPYTTAMGGFSKVSNFIFDNMLSSPSHQCNREDAELAELMQKTFFEMGSSPDVLDFEVITPMSDLCPRPEVQRSQPLSAEVWAVHFDMEGRVIDVDKLKERIFRGGIIHQLRPDVWKFLLGYYDYNTTYRDRQEVKKQKIDSYYRMKLQWKSLSEEQERRFSAFRERKNLIEKDVTRTDRVHPFFQGDNNGNVNLLQDILMTYCMYNFDLGYVQGMSDLLSPILVVMENEVDAFWCFAGFMEKIAVNFEMDQNGMRAQLKNLNTLVQFTDPDFSSYLKRNESDNLYFCFRWLLVLFKRELKFQDILRFWEVLWTELPCKNFLLLMCLAVLDTEKNTLMENGFGFTEILKHINDTSQKINLDLNLEKAEGIFLQLVACNTLPPSVADIVGLPARVAISPGKSRSPSAIGSSTEGASVEMFPDLEKELQCQSGLDLMYN